jgi:hypothetical protein
MLRMIFHACREASTTRQLTQNIPTFSQWGTKLSEIPLRVEGLRQGTGH